MTVIVVFLFFSFIYMMYYVAPMAFIFLIIHYFVEEIPVILKIVFIPIYISLFLVAEMRASNATNIYFEKYSFVQAHLDSGPIIRMALRVLPIFNRLFGRGAD